MAGGSTRRPEDLLPPAPTYFLEIKMVLDDDDETRRLGLPPYGERGEGDILSGELLVLLRSVCWKAGPVTPVTLVTLMY